MQPSVPISFEMSLPGWKLLNKQTSRGGWHSGEPNIGLLFCAMIQPFKRKGFPMLNRLAAALSILVLACTQQMVWASPVTFDFTGTLLQPIDGSSTFSGSFTVNPNPTVQPGTGSAAEFGADVSAVLTLGGQSTNFVNTPQYPQLVQVLVNTQAGEFWPGTGAPTTEFALLGALSAGTPRFAITLYTPGGSNLLTNLANLTLPAIHSDSIDVADNSGGNGGGTVESVGGLTSLTLVTAPEPATILVYLAVIAGLVARGWRSVRGS